MKICWIVSKISSAKCIKWDTLSGYKNLVKGLENKKMTGLQDAK